MEHLTAGAIELHRIAKGFVHTVEDIDHHFSKPARVLIAVERHDKDSEQWLKEAPKDRFLWVKARAKVTIQQIREAYLNQYTGVSPDLAVTIRIDDKIPDDEATVSSMDYFDDKIMVFSAVDQRDLAVSTQGTNAESTHASSGIYHLYEDWCRSPGEISWARCSEKGHGVSRIGLLANQLQTYQAVFQDIIANMVTKVNEGQRDINREFTPVITAAMEPAYDLCTNERGQGSFRRMKDHMANHVDHNKVNMFKAACDQVRNSLAKLVDEVRKQMMSHADTIFLDIQRDYMSIIGGVQTNQVSIPREERAVRREVDDAITSVDNTLLQVIDSSLEDLKASGIAGAEDMEVDDLDEEGKEESDHDSGEDEDADKDADEDEDGDEKEDGQSEREGPGGEDGTDAEYVDAEDGVSAVEDEL